MSEAPAPHYPRPAVIESYGNGGFRFAGMSHRGSLLCLPSGIWAWPVDAPEDLTEAAFAQVIAEADSVSLLLIGTGRTHFALAQGLRTRLIQSRLNVEVTRTGSAVSTYNILIEESRPVAAALIAV